MESLHVSTQLVESFNFSSSINSGNSITDQIKEVSEMDVDDTNTVRESTDVKLKNMMITKQRLGRLRQF